MTLEFTTPYFNFHPLKTSQTAKYCIVAVFAIFANITSNMNQSSHSTIYLSSSVSLESFRLTFFLDNRKPLETMWPKSSGQVTRLRFTFLLLERLLEVSELRQGFYVTFTQPTHVWGVNLYSYMSVVLESPTFLNWTMKQCMSIFGEYVWTIENQTRQLSTSTKYERQSKCSLTC